MLNLEIPPVSNKPESVNSAEDNVSTALGCNGRSFTSSLGTYSFQRLRSLRICYLFVLVPARSEDWCRGSGHPVKPLEIRCGNPYIEYGWLVTWVAFPRYHRTS